MLVVGGGPAGMEAARALAVRGHRVRLAERAPELGGMLAAAALVHGRQRLGVAVDWWRRELQRLGVTVSLGTKSPRPKWTTRWTGACACVLATGSVPGPRDYRIATGARVLEAADLIGLVNSAALHRLPEGRAVVFDPVGGPVGVGIAELLAATGRPVSIVTQDQIAGTQLAITGDLAEANSRLQRAGVARELRSLLRSVADDHVLLEDRWTGEAAHGGLRVRGALRAPAAGADPVPAPARHSTGRRLRGTQDGARGSAGGAPGRAGDRPGRAAVRPPARALTMTGDGR